MEIKWRCGCGMHNYNWQDWISHFKYRGWRSGLRNLLKTRPEFR
jgi:hypothetical protein